MSFFIDGFIGLYLVKNLKFGYQVRIIGNLSSGTFDNKSRIIGNIEFVKEDYKNHNDIIDSIRDMGIFSLDG